MSELMTDFQLIEKAQLFLDSGRYQLALDTLSELKAAPSQLVLSTYYSIYVNSCIRLNKIQKAFDFTLSKLNDDPNNPLLYYLMSRISSENNQNKEGLKYILKAIEIDPEEGQYHTAAAALYFDLGKTNQADFHLRISEEQYPEDEQNIYLRTIIHIFENDRKKASETLKRGLDLNPKSTLFQNLFIHLDSQNRPNLSTLKELSLNALEENPFDPHAQQSLLYTIKNSNPIVRFFVAYGFNRYKIEWTPWSVIAVTLFWKGTLISGGFVLLYLLITWAGTALFYTVIRKHPKYKYILSEKDKYMSNTFLVIIVGALIVLTTIFRVDPSLGTKFGSIAGILFILFTSISYFEIEHRSGRKAFAIFMLISTFILVSSLGNMILFGILSLLLLLIYAFLFTLNITFK